MNQRLVGGVIFPLHERLKAKPTFARLRELEHTQWLDASRLQEYRLARLRRLLEFAYAHAPYYRGLMDEWKAAPRAGRTDEDKLWARFRAAQDAFFDARNSAQSERDGDQLENLHAKEALAVEAEALLPIADLVAAKAAMRTLGERWNAIGHVPRNDRDKIEGRLRKVDDAIKRAEEDQWRRTDPAKRALAESTVETFSASLAKLEKQAAAAEAAGDERKTAELQARITTPRSLLEAAENSLAEYSG